MNLELVFDSSGSMAEQIGGETKIAAARRAIEQVINGLPANSATLNVGFRVFGHRGTNTEAGKAESCQSTELLVPIQGSPVEQLRAQANAWEPTGWTPISLALEQAGKDFSAGENTRNTIIMVTDGEETCGGDPCAVAQSLAQSDTKVRIDLVGFGLTPDVADVLRCVPENSGGIYTDAQDGDALARSLQELVTASVARSYLRILALDETGKPGKRTAFEGIADAQGNRADVLNRPNTYGVLANGEALLELLPGTYTFTVTKSFTGFGGDAGAEGYRRRYTAVVEQGRETVATVGIGGMTLQRGPNADKRVLCNSVFEINNDGTWQEFPLPGLVVGCRESFIFNEEYLLPPGVFRIRDVERDAVIVDSIVIEPGKRVTIEIQIGG